jgi:hypothetical protein
MACVTYTGQETYILARVSVKLPDMHQTLRQGPLYFCFAESVQTSLKAVVHMIRTNAISQHRVARFVAPPSHQANMKALANILV